MTKMEFFQLCLNMNKRFVGVSSVQVVSPALMKMLTEHPECFSSILGTRETATASHSNTPGPSVTYNEDEHDIVVLKDGVLIKILPKVRSSRSSLGLGSPKNMYFAQLRLI